MDEFGVSFLKDCTLAKENNETVLIATCLTHAKSGMDCNLTRHQRTSIPMVVVWEGLLTLKGSHCMGEILHVPVARPWTQHVGFCTRHPFKERQIILSCHFGARRNGRKLIPCRNISLVLQSDTVCRASHTLHLQVFTGMFYFVRASGAIP